MRGRFTFDDAPDGFFVFDLRVDDETGLSITRTHQTPMATDGKRFSVRNSAIRSFHVNRVEITGSAYIQQSLDANKFQSNITHLLQ